MASEPITRPLPLHRAQRGNPVAVLSFCIVGFCLLPGRMFVLRERVTTCCPKFSLL